jgi:hypothetical protein
MLGRASCTAAGGDAAPPAAEAAAAKPCGEKAIGEMPPSGSRMLRAGKVTQVHDRLIPAGHLSGQSHGCLRAIMVCRAPDKRVTDLAAEPGTEPGGSGGRGGVAGVCGAAGMVAVSRRLDAMLRPPRRQTVHVLDACSCGRRKLMLMSEVCMLLWLCRHVATP